MKKNILFATLLISSVLTFNQAFAKPAVENPDMSLIDKKADPCTDYYQYACGNWLAKNEIPSDRAAWDRSFSALSESNLQTLRELLEGYAKGKNTPENPYAKQLGQVYSMCMDEKSHASGVDFVKGKIGWINLTTKENLSERIAWFHKYGNPVFFELYDSQDMKKPESVIAEVFQAGMGLPTKDYYLDQSDEMKTLREKYVAHEKKMLMLIGESSESAQKKADALLKLETELAKVSLSPVEMRDVQKMYNKFRFPLFAKNNSYVNWKDYFKVHGINQPAEINVTSPKYFKGLTQIIKSTPIEDIRAYLSLRLIDALANGLTNDFVTETFEFYGKTMYGQKEQRALWKRCVAATEDQLGFALARSYVDLKFSGNSKEIALQLIQEIEKSLGEDIDANSWMDSGTKKQAHEKLKMLTNKIGYPDKWRNYDGLDMSPATYVEKRMNGSAFNRNYSLNKIGKPLDRNDWSMNPVIINAMYDGGLNSMFFPAGILQGPFFDKEYSMTSNYAAIGMVMGHEASHGYDDQGAQFDGKGAMRDWWGKKSKDEFKKQAECLAGQYDQFDAAPNGHVNGHLTLGEDIGDQGGMKLSYAAWKRVLDPAIKSDPAKFAEESKKFFLAFAQSWCSKETDAAEKVLLKSNPHPPARFRVRGALMNLPEFQETYQCKAGSPMAPVNRCVVW